MAVGVIEAGEKDGRPAPFVHYRQTKRSIGWDEQRVLDQLTEEIGDALEARPDAVGVGIGVPATIDRKRGVAIRGVNLSLENVPIRGCPQRARAGAGLARQHVNLAASPSTASAPPAGHRLPCCSRSERVSAL